MTVDTVEGIPCPPVILLVAVELALVNNNFRSLFAEGIGVCN